AMCMTDDDCSTATCLGGRCCMAGYRDCDADPTNSCETDVMTDELNCGTCGMTCAAGESCYGGACLTQGTGENCSSPWILVDGVNTVSWTATAATYLSGAPHCVLVGTITGPDLVLVYTATRT